MNQTMSHGLMSVGVRRTKGGVGLVLYFLIALTLLLLESFNSPNPSKVRQVAADSATPNLNLIQPAFFNITKSSSSTISILLCVSHPNLIP